MKRLNRNVGFSLLIVLAVSLLAFKLTGCTFVDPSGATTQPTTQPTLDQLVADRAALQEKLDEATTAIELLPAGDPVRAKYEAALPKIQQGLSLADQLIATAQQGKPTPELLTALSAIPVVGNYLPLALMLGGWIYGALTAKQKASLYAAFQQVVQSVEQAMPSKTPEQKQAMAAVQDVKTQALVDQVKKGV